jgi:ubiquinol-cytochrome c reductase cytochrome c1 subunit
MTISRIFAAATAAITLAGFAIASGGDTHAPEQHEWTFDGIFGTYVDADAHHGERNAAQRGFQVYQEVCSSCHALEQISFRNLGEPGAPFWDGEFPNANDNAIVQQIAANWHIPVRDVDGETGDDIERQARSSDKFPWVYSNDIQARATLGALPPDLSLIVSARTDGANYVRSLLMGYDGHVPEDVHLSAGQNYNPYFPNGIIAMAAPLADGQVDYVDGTEATVAQMSNDVVVFLAWASDPHMEKRKQMGVMVMLFLFIFAILVYLAYRQIWSDVEH